MKTLVYTVAIVLAIFSMMALADTVAGDEWHMKIADYLWVLIVALAGLAWRSLMKLNALEQRTLVLEDHHKQQLSAFTELTSKVDANQNAVVSSLNELRNEIREDLRIVMQTLLGNGHR